MEMSLDKQYITKTGLEKLVAELETWRTEKRPAMVKQLATARAHGDLSENAEYHAAREELTRIDQKIMQLETILQTAELIDETNVNTDQVRIFTRVRIRDIKKNRDKEFSLVSATEANPTEGKISHQSPVGQGLMGRKVGETVEIQIPSGTVQWKILEILPLQA
jgi:transcription elongation factor GreA